MELNFKPCYQIVFSYGIYSLQIWDSQQKSYVEQFCTDEKPQAIGNFIIFRDLKASSDEQKIYRTWYYDDQRGICVFNIDILFNDWCWYEGNFLCAYPLADGKEQWLLIAPKTLQATLLGQPIGQSQYKCFVSSQDKTLLHYFQRSLLQAVAVDDIWSDSAGSVFYRIRGDIYGMEKYPLPDGGSNWRFALKS